MERTQQIARGLGLALLLIPMVGCLKSLPTLDDVTSMKFISEPVPVSELICFWQRQIQPLPDPTQDGHMTMGLPGQIFLIGPNGEYAQPHGSVTIAMYDDTPRPSGIPSAKPELIHYTAETVRQMKALDSRFGRCYGMFLPWPPEWTDVTHVRVSARYDSPDKPTIYSPEIRMKVEFQSMSSGDWTVLEDRKDLRQASSQAVGVPDPNQFVQQLSEGMPGDQQGVVQAIATEPIAPRPPESGTAWKGPPPPTLDVTKDAWRNNVPMNPSANAIQPIIISR